MWRGDGVSRDRASGKWLYKFYNDGVLYRQRGFPTQREARQACNAKRVQIRDQPPQGDDLSFAECASQYLYHHAPPRLASATHRKYTYALEMMGRAWGKLPLRALTSHMIEDYARWRMRTPVPGGFALKPRMAGGPAVNRDLATLSAMLNWAHEKPRRWLPENPCEGLERFQEPRKTYQPITPEERKEMWLLLGPEAPKADLLHALGVRVGVVMDLRWEQVDFGTKTIVYRSKGRDITRVLGGRAISILRSLGPKPNGFVFEHRSDAAFRTRWRRAAAKIGRPTLRRHDLRITFAREMADAGVDTGTIRDMLGHTTTTMTERYIGSSRAAQIRATQLHDARAGFA